MVLPGINNYASEYTLAPNTTFTTPSFYLYLFLFRKRTGFPGNLHQWATNYGIYKGKENKSTLLNNWGSYFILNWDEQKLTSLWEMHKIWEWMSFFWMMAGLGINIQEIMMIQGLAVIGK